MRKVDKLGRIVIPLELRKKYGLTEGAAIEFLDGGEGITVRSAEHSCRICRERIAEDPTLPLCKSCIEQIVKQHSEKLKIDKETNKKARQ